MKNSKKNSILKNGSIIGVVAPSWAGPGVFPKVFELGLRMLEENFNLKIKEYPNTRGSKQDLFNNPKKRAEDLMMAFEDSETDMIISAIGGNDSIRILPYLNMQRIKNNPKPFMGFSDTTTLLTFLSRNGINTIHGPSIMAGFSEPEGLQEEFIDNFINFFMKPWSEINLIPYKKWTEMDILWSDPDFMLRKKEYKNNDGWKILQGDRKFSGRLYGGNIEIFEMLKGTPFMEDLNFLEGKILFLETSEEMPGISYIKYSLRSMAIRGVFNKISGLLFGRAKGYSTDDKEKIHKAIKDVISEEFLIKDLPIIADMDFGHTQPQWFLPLNAKAEVDPDKKTFTIVENPFAN